MRRIPQAALFAALAVSSSRCVCAPVDNGGDDDSVQPAIDARRPPVVVDAPPEIDAPPATPIPPDCFDAATRGLAWLVTQQQADGAYGVQRKIAVTGFAVLKLETYASELGLSPFDQAFVYHNQVRAGLDWLFLQARSVPLAPQPHGNPDGNGNLVALDFTGGQHIYDHSIAVMAIVAGSDPDQVVHVPGSAVDGRTYRAVVEDAVDYLAMAQSDALTSAPSSCMRGGWRYTKFDNTAAVGDQSVTQWAALALEYARHPLYHYEIPIQDWVITELRDWVACIQNHSGGLHDGGAGYTSGSEAAANAYRTGALVQQQSLLGDMPDAPRVVAALAYLQRMWNDPTYGWRKPPVSSYLSMYSIMKGMESMAIDQLGTIDWYRELCNQLKLEQLADGSWPASQWDIERVGASGLLSTEWALLTLERAAPPPEVIP